MKKYAIIVNGKVADVVETNSEDEAYSVGSDLGYDVFDVQEQKQKESPKDATWVNVKKNQLPIQPIQESEGTFNYEFSSPQGKIGTFTFQSRPSEKQLVAFAKEKGMPDKVSWHQRPATYKQVKESVDSYFGDNSIALFPRTAKSVGRGESALNQSIAAGLDIASITGRSIGAAIDKGLSFFNDKNKSYSKTPSMFYTGGDIDPTEDIKERNVFGKFVQEIIRDPSNIILPFAEVSKLGKLSNLASKSNSGRFIKAVNNAKSPIIEGSLQAGSEVANAPTEDRDVSGIGVVSGAIAPSIGKVSAKNLKSGAVRDLQQDVKLKPTSQNRTFRPELEVLFENNDIPVFGGTKGIHENVKNRLSNLGVERDKYLNEKEKESIDKIANANINEGQVIKELEDSGLVVNLDKIAQDAINYIESLSLERKKEQELKNIVLDKIEDLKTRNTLVDAQKNAGYQPESDISPFVPLSVASKRRTIWFGQGDVNNPKTSDLSPNEKFASNILWDAVSNALNKNKTYSGYGKEFSQYIPLENAIDQRTPALENRNTMPINIFDIPLWTIREGLRSNPALIARYNAGKSLGSDGLSESRFLLGSTAKNISNDQNNESYETDVQLFDQDKKLIELLKKRKNQ